MAGSRAAAEDQNKETFFQKVKKALSPDVKPYDEHKERRSTREQVDAAARKREIDEATKY